MIGALILVGNGAGNTEGCPTWSVFGGGGGDSRRMPWKCEPL